MPNRRYNTQVAQPLKNGGRAKAMGGGIMRKGGRVGCGKAKRGFGRAMKKGGKK